MAFSEFEEARFTQIVKDWVEENRPPKQIRAKLDLQFVLEKQSFIIFEVRPYPTGEVLKTEVVKITFVKTQKLWKLYWMKSDLKWHAYDLDFEHSELEDVLAEIKDDPYCCFWG